MWLVAAQVPLMVSLASGATRLEELPSASPPPHSETRLVDRVLAVVDDDPILDSDVERVIFLGLVDSQPGEDRRSLRRRVLDFLIEQRLRFHEVDRHEYRQVPLDLVEEQISAIRDRFAGDESFRLRLAEVGMSEEALRQLVARQLRVLSFVEERLGSRVFVGLEDIRDYYDEQLVPELRATGEPLPPFDEVRENIRAVLRQQRLNEEIERWTRDLRRDADVIDYLDVRHDELPPRLFFPDN